MATTEELRAKLRRNMQTMKEIGREAERSGFTPEMRDRFDAAEAGAAQIEYSLSQRRDRGADHRGAVSMDRDSAAFDRFLRSGVTSPELRAAGEATGSAGGFLVPESFLSRLALALKKYGGLSADFAPVETDDGRLMPFPTNNPTAVQANYLTENTAMGDTDYVFGEGILNAWTIASGVIKASLQLMQDSAIDVEQFVAERIGEQMGRKIGAEVVSGAGAGSSAASGIIPSLNAFGAVSGASGGYLGLGTATSVALFGGSTTELAGNVISPATAFKMIAAVDPAYYDGAAFYMNTTQALNMRQVVDTAGRPLLNLEDGFRDGAIGTIGGFPVKVVQEIPNLTASTTGGPVFGNMAHAMVLRTVKAAGVMRLDERYAEYLQVGFIGYMRWDSQPSDLRAACVVKPAAT